MPASATRMRPSDGSKRDTSSVRVGCPISQPTHSGPRCVPIPDTLTCCVGWQCPLRVRDMTITRPILPFTKIIAAIWLLSVAPSVAQTRISDQELVSKANEYMDNLDKLDYFSGAVLIARDGRVLVSRGYGMADLEHDVPNAPTTKFRIGSVTKPFTAMAVMLLQEQSRLSVHDSVCKYLLDCPAEWQPITIHHLLSHTSGIPSFADFPDNDDYERKHMTLLATMDRFKNKPLEFKPGEKFNHSDSNYLVLAYVI